MIVEFQAMLHDVIDESPVNDYVATDDSVTVDTNTSLVTTTTTTKEGSPDTATPHSSRVSRTHGLYEQPSGVSRKPTFSRDVEREQGVNRDVIATRPKDQVTQHTTITVEPTETSVRYKDRYPSASTVVSGEDMYIQSSRSRIFCGQDRSSSPFGMCRTVY